MNKFKKGKIYRLYHYSSPDIKPLSYLYLCISTDDETVTLLRLFNYFNGPKLKRHDLTSLAAAGARFKEV